MLNSLLVNTAILISFLYLSSQLFTNHAIDSKSSLLTTSLVGTLFGLAGCLLMVNGIHFSNNVLIDFRAFALMYAIVFCGPLAGGLSALIMVVFRAGFFGVTSSTLVAIANLLVLLIVFTLVHKSQLSFPRKYIYMLAAHITGSLLIIKILLPTDDLILHFFYQYLISAAAVGVVLYFVLSYIFKTNGLYLQLQRESTRDSLTGLYNVRAFDKFLNQSIAHAVDKGEPLSLLMIDIDFFKKINDTYGHTAGDMVLKQLSEVVTDSCRGHDFVSRNGGEEFTVILVDCDDKAAFHIAERIRKNVAGFDFALSKNEKINITVSIGVSSYPCPTSSPIDLLREADGALYLAKRGGRNAVKGASLLHGASTLSDAAGI